VRQKLYYLGYIILLDLIKAFDTVNHKFLLNKLEKFGIRSISLSLIKSYLSHRKQTVHINNTRSSLKPISCGVPQEFILGPLLFSIYFNDLPKASKFVTRLYADDTAILSGKTSYELNKNVNNELLIVEN